MKENKKWSIYAIAGLFTIVGTYNAVVINSESQVSGPSSYKRLDEIYGVTVQGREVAGNTSSVKWRKLVVPKASPLNAIPAVEVAKTESRPVVNDSIIPAAVQEELNLNLVEVINSKKWQNGLPANQFNGSLSTKEGSIESLSVALPNGEGISVAFSEMNGNVFEYDMNGEIYSGMMYQVDQSAYMVTLTNGPLEGTRLRFSSVDPQAEQQIVQQQLADSNVQVGTFGESPQAEMQAEQAPVEDTTVQSQGFNMNQQVI